MPIFILSCERSGSTLLRFLLDTHPDVVAPGELGLGDLCQRLVLVKSRTVGQQKSRPVSVVPDWVHNRNDSLSPEVREILVSTRQTVEGIMDPYMRAAGKKRWCEKAPSNLPFANLLRLTFPDAQFLCLYRHGLDVAHSCLELSKHGFMKELVPYVLTSPGDTVTAVLRSWLDKTAKLLDFESSFPQICHRVRYEDLVENPQESLLKILEFLDLPKRDVHERVFRSTHHAGGGDPKIWQTDHIHTERVGCGANLPISRLPQALLDKIDDLLRTLNYREIGHALS